MNKYSQSIASILALILYFTDGFNINACNRYRDFTSLHSSAKFDDYKLRIEEYLQARNKLKLPELSPEDVINKPKGVFIDSKLLLFCFVYNASTFCLFFRNLFSLFSLVIFILTNFQFSQLLRR